MKIYFIYTIISISILLPSTSFAGKITRSCTGTIEVVTRTVPNYEVFKSPSFTGKGRCGRLVPNRCRERAAENLKRCVNSHWLSKVVNGAQLKPKECTTEDRVYNYPYVNFRSELEKSACDYFKEDDTGDGIIRVNVRLTTSGKSGCIGGMVRATNHRINCGQYR